MNQYTRKMILKTKIIGATALLLLLCQSPIRGESNAAWYAAYERSVLEVSSRAGKESKILDKENLNAVIAEMELDLDLLSGYEKSEGKPALGGNTMIADIKRSPYTMTSTLQLVQIAFIIQRGAAEKGDIHLQRRAMTILEKLIPHGGQIAAIADIAIKNTMGNDVPRKKG